MEGRQEGKREGEEKGIQALVTTLKGLSISKDIAAQTLVDKFGLLPQAAKEKVRQYWG